MNCLEELRIFGLEIKLFSEKKNIMLDVNSLLIEL